MALAVYPELKSSPDFPSDAKDRAERVLGACRGHSVGESTMGSYSSICI